MGTSESNASSDSALRASQSNDSSRHSTSSMRTHPKPPSGHECGASEVSCHCHSPIPSKNYHTSPIALFFMVNKPTSPHHPFHLNLSVTLQNRPTHRYLIDYLAQHFELPQGAAVQLEPGQTQPEGSQTSLLYRGWASRTPRDRPTAEFTVLERVTSLG